MRILDFSEGLDLDAVDEFIPRTQSDPDVDRRITRIVTDVRDRGDAAVFDYTRRFDGFHLDRARIRVSSEEIEEYASGADDDLVEILRLAASNIRQFHQEQRQESWEVYAGDGVHLGQRVSPIERVGLYIPGFKAAYPSSVLMNAIPAQVAGVGRIVVATPPRSLAENPLVAAALGLLGIDEVYRVGGAQAIAALAYGTESIPAVDKIVGPGNRFVQGAKRIVFGQVHIDMIAGPSEVAVVADQTCDPAWIAADLLAQAEHDELARVWLVCWSEDVAAAVFDQVQIQLETLDRDAIARVSIANNGVSFIVSGEEDAVRLVNHLAAEHVEVLMAEPDRIAEGIRNAGAVFVGRYSPAVVGDYFAGPNHVLPTGRSARFFSPLGVYDFMKRTSVVRYSGRAIERSGNMIEKFAIAEGLTGHARSITIRNH
jgi:histidinol dehydrogenase